MSSEDLTGTGGHAGRAQWLAVALLGLAWLAFTAPMFAGRVHFPTAFGPPYFSASSGSGAGQPAPNPADTDQYQAVYPYHVFLGQQLRSGHLPLWDPTRFAGAPYAADIVMGVFYPPNWLYALGNAAVVGTWIWAGTLLASLLMAYWFLRVLKLHPLAAALGSIVWTFCGWMVVWASVDPVLESAVWLPLVLGGLELARAGRRRCGIPLAGIGLALSLLAGHIQVTYYVWLAAAGWLAVATLAETWPALRQGRAGRPALVVTLGRAAGVGAGAFAIGAGLASVQILGTLQYAGHIVRQTETLATIATLRVPAAQFKTLLLPDFFGNPVHGTYLGAAEYYTETAFYVGVAALPLAVAGILHPRRRLSAGFALLVVGGAAIALGTPLLHVLFLALPGFGHFRWIDRILLVVDVGLAGLAALGLDAILSRSRAVTAAALGTSGALLLVTAALVATRWGTPIPAAHLTPGGIRALVILLGGGGLVGLIAWLPARLAGARTAAAVGLVALACADLWLFGFAYNPFERPAAQATTPEIQYLQSVPGSRPRYVLAHQYSLPPNASMVYPRLFSVDGYDPFLPGTFVQLLDPVQANLGTIARNYNAIPALTLPAQLPPILALLGVHSVVAAPGQAAPGVLAHSGPVQVFDQPGAFPEAFVVTCWAQAADGTGQHELAGMDTTGLRSRVVVAAGQQVTGLAPPSPGCAPGPDVTVTRYTTQAVTLEVPASSPGGTLVLTDQWDPGWTVTVDGRSAALLRVDLALRGVGLSPGAHRVEFRYQPRWVLQGLLITGLTAVLTALTALWPRPRRR